ncbi:hypothetical protein EIP86_010546 [Pleurotus ostreatoroseus]|nr:hypothetical protein EIP86_010546 [Pleurotus ostreatoroseus]
MYSGQGYYYPPPSSIHDEASLTYTHNQSIYHPASYQQQAPEPRYPIYRNPSSAPPPASTPYYPHQPLYGEVYAAPPPVPQPSQFARGPIYDPAPVPQHYIDDPAFSNDPRVNPHFTMNDMEEITPIEARCRTSYGFSLRTNRSPYPDYRDQYYNDPYLSRDPSRAASSTRELQAAYGPIYGPPVIPEKLSQANSNRSQHRDYESSIRTHSSHARPAEGAARSREDVRLAYDDPPAAARSSHSVASQAVKSYSGSSTSSAAANGRTRSPYEVYIPRPLSSSSSGSSANSSPPPRTPPGPSGSLPSQQKGSTTSFARSKLTVSNPDVPSAVIEAPPPAYTPLPTPLEPNFVQTVAAPAPDASTVSVATVPTVATMPSAPVTDQRPLAEVTNAVPFPTPQPQDVSASVTGGAALSGSATEQPRAAPTNMIPPGAAPEPIRIQKSRSRKTSATKDLDKIDELDETDPLGFAWHHESPYEAIKKAVDSGLVPGQGAEHKKGKPKIFETGRSGTAGGHATSSSYRTPAVVDPNLTQFKVKPGQLFPSIIATSHARAAHQQVFGPSSVPDSLPSQQPAPKMYTNAHMRPAAHPHLPPPQPVFPAPEATDERATSQRPPVQTTSSHSSSGSGRQSSRSGSESSHRTKLSRHSPPATAADEPPKAPKASRTTDRPSLQHQASSVSLARSISAPNARPPVPPTESLPRPDIRLPPRGAPSMTSSHQSNGPQRQPHYLPKRLVMPAPLQQQQQQQQQPSANTSADTEARMRERELAYLRERRDEANRAPKGGAPLKHSASVPSSRAARAQDIPMSSGRHLLKKTKSREAAAYVEPEVVKEKEKENKERRGVHIGGFTIIPALGHGHSSGGAKHGAKGWEKEEEKKEKGKKLSKRR